MMKDGRPASDGVAGMADNRATSFIGTRRFSSSQAAASCLSLTLGIFFMEGILMPILSIILLSSGLMESSSFCASCMASSISFWVGADSFCFGLVWANNRWADRKNRHGRKKYFFTAAFKRLKNIL